jgi:hypothetical protein
MTRRSVLKGFGALFACLVLPSSILNSEILEPVSAETSAEILQRCIDSGKIANQVFYFNHPVKFTDMHNMLIENCTFIFDYQDTASAFTVENCKDLYLENITFDTTKCRNCTAVVAVNKDFEFDSHICGVKVQNEEYARPELFKNNVYYPLSQSNTMSSVLSKILN